MTQLYYTGTNQQCLDIDTIITSNCGWPVGGTIRWAAPLETTTNNVYAIPAPPAEGSHGFTKAQMVAGVSAQEQSGVTLKQEVI